MSFFPGTDPESGDAFACDAIETLIVPRARDLGVPSRTPLSQDCATPSPAPPHKGEGSSPETHTPL